MSQWKQKKSRKELWKISLVGGKKLLSVRFCALFFAALFLALCSLHPDFSAVNQAQAVEPMKLQDPITDPQNVLSDKKTQLYDAIKDVKNKTNQNLWVIFVPSFDGANEDINKDGKIDSNDWVDSVAKSSNLGADDVILAVATTKHEMVVYISSESRYLKQKNLDIITNATMVSLQQGEWGKAALKFCESVDKQILSNDSKIGYFIVIPLFLALVGYLAISMIRRIRREKAEGEQMQSDALSDLEYAGVANLLSSPNTGYLQAVNQNAYTSQISSPYLQTAQYGATTSSTPSWLNSYSSAAQTTGQIGATVSTPSALTGALTGALNSTMTGTHNAGANVASNMMASTIANAATGVSAATGALDAKMNNAQTPVSFSQILQEIESTGKNYATSATYTPASGSASNISASTRLDALKRSSRSRLDALYDQYGISKDSTTANNSTPSATKGAAIGSTKEIYGDYYTRSASRFLYGSYYSDGQAAKHDQSINELSARFNNTQAIYQPIGVDVNTNINTNYAKSSQELYNKYYSTNSRGFLDRFKK
jgi:hypothetical protein